LSWNKAEENVKQHQAQVNHFEHLASAKLWNKEGTVWAQLAFGTLDQMNCFIRDE